MDFLELNSKVKFPVWCGELFEHSKKGSSGLGHKASLDHLKNALAVWMDAPDKEAAPCLHETKDLGVAAQEDSAKSSEPGTDSPLLSEARQG